MRLVGALVLAMGVCFCAAAQALALPEGRVYEMVSPVYKGGYGAQGIDAVSPDGESVAFFSLGGFAQAPGGAKSIDYLARRGALGWSTAPLMPPAASLPYVVGQDVSATLDSALALGKPGPSEEAAFQAGTEEEFLLHPTDKPDTQPNWEVAGMVLRALSEEPFSVVYEGASGDFCHLLFNYSNLALLPEALGVSSGSMEHQIYELEHGCGSGSTLRLLGVKNKLGAHEEPEPIDPLCGVNLGIEEYGKGRTNRFNAIAAGGMEIFFTASVGKITDCKAVDQLFVRINGARTLEVSRPLDVSKPFGGCGTEGEVPCPGAATRASAYFAGASEDGSRVFFMTAEPLVDEDLDGASDLYLATISCPTGEAGCEVDKREVASLVQVSHDPSAGEAAELQGVVRVAPDGSRVYFVARGVLGAEPNAQGAQPVAGADNLYVYERDERYPSGHTLFIADLCSGPVRSGPGSVQEGAVEDLRCPRDLEAASGTRNDVRLWENGEAQTAARDGRFLVFASYGRLLAGDTDNAKDVYRYDALTGGLDRVSLGEAGTDANGNRDDGEEEDADARISPGHAGGLVIEQNEMDSRAVSEDGARIVFETAEPLSENATNRLSNVYEWHERPGGGEGSVSLVSGGRADEPVGGVVISPSGRDVFFTTSQGLVPQDTDGANDIYDARLGGGFPPPLAPRQPCSGDACQGPLTTPPLPVAGSVSQLPGGNFAAPASKRAAKAKKAKPKKKARKKHKKRGSASQRSREAERSRR
jgi:hypothetical protein